MNINLKKTLKTIENLICTEEIFDLQKLRKAYEYTLRLRAQLIGVITDIEEYVEQDNGGKDYSFQDITNEIVILKIKEPLPSVKELTSSVEEQGIFFKDDDFEHMACGIVADWGKVGEPVIKICDLKMLSSLELFNTKLKNL